MTSASALLDQKIIPPNDPNYRLVPIMAVWSMKCPKCGSYCVSSSRIGVMQRYRAHVKQCAPKMGDKEDQK